MPTSFRKQAGGIAIGAAIIATGGTVTGVTGIGVGGIIAIGATIIAAAGGHGVAATAAGSSALPAQNLPRVKQGSSIASQLTQDFQGAG